MAKLETEDSVNAGKQTLHLVEVHPRQPIAFWDGPAKRIGVLLEFRDANGALAEHPAGVVIVKEFNRVYFVCEEAAEKIPLRAD